MLETGGIQVHYTVKSHALPHPIKGYGFPLPLSDNGGFFFEKAGL
jgi:hypothetical protein